MNILIADDEFYARKALAQIIHDWDSTLHVIETQNGQEALSVLAKEEIDLVFTDIRMPLVDGLAFSAEIFERYPQTTNVIISGYDDFKYAQEAIVYNVKQYLLKPLEKREIFKILEHAKLKADARSAQHISDKLYSIFHEESDAAAEEIGLPHVHSFITAVLQTTDNQKFTFIDEMISEVLSGHRYIHYHMKENRHSNMWILLLIASDRSAAEKLWIRGSLFREIHKKYSEVSDGRMTIGISGIHLQLAALPESYRNAKNALLHRLFDDKTYVFDYEETRKNVKTEPNLVNESIHPIYNKILNNQITAVNSIIDQLLKRMVELQLPVHALNDICSRLISILNAVIESMNQKFGEFMPYFEPVVLFDFHSLEQLTGFFEKALADVAQMIEIVKPSTDMIDEIKAYVEQHYQHNIKLEELAKNIFYADPSHLSKQFKKRYGISFSQYLISVRLNQARKMLELGGALSVSEIARAVGYNDDSYFIHMYKKQFGETPGQHMKSN